jgi:membrane-bound lytic murein transglycosylase B
MRLGLSATAALMLAACAPQQAQVATMPVPSNDPYAFTHITQTSCPQTAASFPDWVEHYEAFAYHQGQPKDLIVQAFQPVKENPSITAKQAKQPEFVTPVWTYLAKAVSQDRIARGQQAYALNRAVVDQTAAQYGVDPGT